MIVFCHIWCCTESEWWKRCRSLCVSLHPWSSLMNRSRKQLFVPLGRVHFNTQQRVQPTRSSAARRIKRGLFHFLLVVLVCGTTTANVTNLKVKKRLHEAAPNIPDDPSVNLRAHKKLMSGNQCWTEQYIKYYNSSKMVPCRVLTCKHHVQQYNTDRDSSTFTVGTGH